MTGFVSRDIAIKLYKKMGIETLSLAPYEKIDSPVSSHADMLINIIEENIFCYSDYYEENKEIFSLAEKKGYRIVKCSPPVSSRYPDDIGLNALVIGKRIFGKEESIAPELKREALKMGYAIINVNQGYTSCSTLVLNESNIITADISIKKAAEKYDINVTLIDEKSIRLDGYGYGFIGGATFVYENKIYFFGDASKLSSYSKIKQTADANNMEIISIMSGEVVDFGGIRLLK
ncbi:MAG: hypothetical protein IJX51_02145 [Clostridia bacterium]|nr:hypothetical protein [Clostridia bacterium]